MQLNGQALAGRKLVAGRLHDGITALSKVPNREPEPDDRLAAPANKPLQRSRRR